MASSRRFFFKASPDAVETVRRNRRMIRQVAYLCAGSELELDDSYDLLRRVQRSLNDTPATEPAHAVNRELR